MQVWSKTFKNRSFIKDLYIDMSLDTEKKAASVISEKRELTFSFPALRLLNCVIFTNSILRSNTFTLSVRSSAVRQTMEVLYCRS